MWLLIAQIGGFIPGLFNKQLSFKVAKVVGVAILAVAVVGLFFLGKYAYDRSVINDFKVEQRADIAEDTLAADREATEETQNALDMFDNSQAVQNEAMEEAARTQPKAAAKEVGPVTQSYYDTLPPAKGSRR